MENGTFPVFNRILNFLLDSNPGRRFGFWSDLGSVLGSIWDRFLWPLVETIYDKLSIVYDKSDQIYDKSDQVYR